MEAVCVRAEVLGLRGQARVFFFLAVAVGLAGRVHSSVSFSRSLRRTRTTSARQAPQRKPKVHFKMPQPVDQPHRHGSLHFTGRDAELFDEFLDEDTPRPSNKASSSFSCPDCSAMSGQVMKAIELRCLRPCWSGVASGIKLVMRIRITTNCLKPVELYCLRPCWSGVSLTLRACSRAARLIVQRIVTVTSACNRTSARTVRSTLCPPA